MIKRIRRGGCRSKAELKRQMDYITQESKMPAPLERELGEGERIWGSMAGMGPEPLNGFDLEEVIESWTSGWRGQPKLGHTDHLILSFPAGTEPGRIKDIAEEWGERIFGSGDFGDRWDYVASMHADRAHGHVHFIVNKRGIEDQNWLSISRHGELNYDLMREIHAEVAREHGLELHASSRFSRGIFEPKPDQRDYREAEREGREAARLATPPAALALASECFAEGYAKVATFCGIAAEKHPEHREELTRASQALSAAASLVQAGERVEPCAEALLSAPGSEALHQVFRELIDPIDRVAEKIAAMPEGEDKAEFQQRFAEMAQRSPALAAFSEAALACLRPDQEHRAWRAQERGALRERQAEEMTSLEAWHAQGRAAFEAEIKAGHESFFRQNAAEVEAFRARMEQGGLRGLMRQFSGEQERDAQAHQRSEHNRDALQDQIERQRKLLGERHRRERVELEHRHRAEARKQEAALEALSAREGLSPEDRAEAYLEELRREPSRSPRHHPRERERDRDRDDGWEL